jgi:hypothetical protein
MIKPKLMFCAETVVIDAETNTTSVFNIFDEILSETLPFILPRLVVVFILERDVDDENIIDLTLNIVVAEQLIFTQANPFNFQGRSRARGVFTLGGMPISTPGVLTVSLWYKDALLADYSMDVHEPRQLSTQLIQSS